MLDFELFRMRARSSLETRLLSKEWLKSDLVSDRSAVKLPLRGCMRRWEAEAADTVAALERFVALAITEAMRPRLRLCDLK